MKKPPPRPPSFAMLLDPHRFARRECRYTAADHSLRHHFGAALKVAICSITGFHSACSVRM